MTTELLVSASPEASVDASMLEEFWTSDTWMMRKCPLGVGNGIIRFVGLTDQLSIELKVAIRAKFTDREWSVESKQAFLVNRIVSWLTTDYSTTASLLDRPLEAWMHSFRRYLLDRGILRQPIQQELTRTQEIRRWPLRDPAIVMLRSLYAKQRVLFRPSPPIPEFVKDIWDVRRMGVADGPVRSDHSLNFVKLTQPGFVWRPSISSAMFS